MRQLFDRDIIEKAIAPPEEIEKAKQQGRFFQYSDPSEEVLITGYWWNGVSYITDISPNHSMQRNAKSRVR